MAGNFQISGGADLKRLSKQLKEMGDKEVASELRKGLTRAVKPLPQLVKLSAPDRLPDRYAAELVKDLRITRRFRGRANEVRLDLIGSAKGRGGKTRDLASLNRGRLRHQLFGNRDHWFDQRIRTDWWDHPLLAWSPGVRRELERVFGHIKRKIERGL